MPAPLSPASVSETLISPSDLNSYVSTSVPNNAPKVNLVRISHSDNKAKLKTSLARTNEDAIEFYCDGGVAKW